MKTERIICSLAVATVLAFASGCEKKDQTAAPESAASEAAPKESTVASQISAATDNVKQTAENVTTEVKQATQNATAAATSKMEELKAGSQSLIDKAKALVNDKKYEDALASLKQLSNVKLTPEQQKTVDDLKAQIQKLMSSSIVTNTASALGNMFKQ
ncbi:MAG: hypothetical protein ACTHLW_17500 [Verrucomicrobiota bacterium]